MNYINLKEYYWEQNFKNKTAKMYIVITTLTLINQGDFFGGDTNLSL